MEFIRTLVETKSVTSFLATGLLITFPYHVRYPDEKLLKESETLLDLNPEVDNEVRKVAILSFASLIHNTCGNKMCSNDTQNKYIKLFLDRFIGQCCYEKNTIVVFFLNDNSAQVGPSAPAPSPPPSGSPPLSPLIKKSAKQPEESKSKNLTSTTRCRASAFSRSQTLVARHERNYRRFRHEPRRVISAASTSDRHFLRTATIQTDRRHRS